MVRDGRFTIQGSEVREISALSVDCIQFFQVQPAHDMSMSVMERREGLHVILPHILIPRDVVDRHSLIEREYTPELHVVFNIPIGC